jgi:hypothetical protein
VSKLVKIKTLRARRGDTAPKIVLTQAEFDAQKCEHCGGAHLRACGRVKRMIFSPAHQLNEIEFFHDDEWDKSSVFWPEDIEEEELDD